MWFVFQGKVVSRKALGMDLSDVGHGRGCLVHGVMDCYENAMAALVREIESEGQLARTNTNYGGSSNISAKARDLRLLSSRIIFSVLVSSSGTHGYEDYRYFAQVVVPVS